MSSSTSTSTPALLRKSGPSVNNPFVNHLSRATISLEYASLRYQFHCPLGMYVIPFVDDLSIWDAVLFIHQGYYTDSILKFRLTFPDNYPERPPTVHFTTDVFHPLISHQDGTFNLAPKFNPWRSAKEHHAHDILYYIKASFKKHALDQIKESDCLNKEAFRRVGWYHDTTSSFAALAIQSSMLSQTASALFDQDHPSMANAKGPPHSLIFRELNREQSSVLRARLGLQAWEDPPQST
ncbi:ubiquitin-conjugating enzyme/RWD-like protein [Multifurca ochricompacta]|uniref:Ubiquitin-conjugating enzyme/RWD-like protein n=1 Tax=Multifurca ochricompacta TaxID=376703 RepID=A0AAD4MBQ8_9AGAM|nr:ubiquitin-conjugating enzyme/RWD-like protein [Multifurca ochricompacta]